METKLKQDIARPDSALVNAHAHTEWHCCRNVAGRDGFLPWVRRVLALETPPDWRRAVAEAAAEMKAEGIVAVGDYGAVDSAVKRGLIAGRHYLELLRDAPLPPDADSIAIHAVHTVPRSTLESLARRNLHLSVHAGESGEEMMLYREGAGSMADLLLERGFSAAHIASLRGLSPLSILDKLGLVGPRMQVVHAMHLPESDLKIIAERGAHIVLCPVSNREIGTAFLPGDESFSRVMRMFDMGISLALGTDSTLSCQALSLKDNAAILEDIGIMRTKIEPMMRNWNAIGLKVD